MTGDAEEGRDELLEQREAVCDCPGCTGGPVPQDCGPTCPGCISGQHGRWRRHEHFRAGRAADSQLRRDLDLSKAAVGRLLEAEARLRADLDEARRLVTMLLEYGTEGLDYDTLPEWARGKQW